MQGALPSKTAARHQLCLGVPLLHVARTAADAVPITTGWSDISMAGVTSTRLPCLQAGMQAGTIGLQGRDAGVGGPKR